MAAAISKIAKCKIVTLGDVGNVRITALRSTLIMRCGEARWRHIALWILKTKLQKCITKRFSDFIWMDYKNVMGAAKFKRVMKEKLKNIRWSKHWFFKSQEQSEALRKKNYSLNMLVEWLTPSADELIPVLDADEEAKLRYIQFIRKRRFLSN